MSDEKIRSRVIWLRAGEAERCSAFLAQIIISARATRRRLYGRTAGEQLSSDAQALARAHGFLSQLSPWFRQVCGALQIGD